MKRSQEMGFEINNTNQPQTTWGDYTRWCNGFRFILPFFGDTLINNPPPWIQNYFQNQWYGNGGNLPNLLGGNPGSVGDSLQYNYGPTINNGDNSGNIKKTKNKEKEEEKDLSAQEKLAQREEKATKKAEIKTLVSNYNSYYKLLEEFGTTLTDKSEPKKAVFEGTLEAYKNKANNNMSKEDLESAITDIKALYTKHKESIKTAVIDKKDDEITSTNNSNYKVTDIANAINAGNDSTYRILKNNSGSKSWDDDKSILEFLSTWNSTAGTENTHIMNTLAEKFNSEADPAKKSNLSTFADILHVKLLDEVDEFSEAKLNKITAETKEKLEEAKSQLEKFGQNQRLEEGQNYSKAFDNLYRALRLAEAELKDAKLNEEYSFLGEENPYKGTTITEAAKKDLEKECLSTYRTEIKAPKPISQIPTSAKTIKVDNTEYKVVDTGEGQKIYNATTKEEVTDLGTVKFAGDNYSITKNGETNYYNNQHTKIQEKVFTAAKVEQAIKNGEAPANGSVKNAVGNQYDIFKSAQVALKGRSGRDIIQDPTKINRESIIGFIDNYEKTKNKYDKKGIIEHFSSYRVDKDNCNIIVKVVMRQAYACGLNETNCTEYKALYDYFGVQGELGSKYYQEDGYTPIKQDLDDPTRYRFTKHDGGKNIIYNTNDAQEIDTMLYALVDRIKALDTEYNKKQAEGS